MNFFFKSVSKELNIIQCTNVPVTISTVLVGICPMHALLYNRLQQSHRKHTMDVKLDSMPSPAPS